MIMKMTKYIALMTLCLSCNTYEQRHINLNRLKTSFIANKGLTDVACDEDGYLVCFAQTKDHTQVKFICEMDHNYCYYPVK
jgi:hypothetical protein